MGNISIEKFRNVYETSDEYKEVREHDVMKFPHIISLSGSHSYGTAREDSDIDIRAVVGIDKTIAIGMDQDWGAIDFDKTDTTVYSYLKFLQLILKGNPSILCILGNDLDDYLYLSEEGKELVTNYSGLVLAKPVYDSFVGYSIGMLKRLELYELSKLNECTDTTNNIKIADKKVDILNNHINIAPSRYDTLLDNNIQARFEIKDEETYVKDFHVKDISMIDFFDIVKELKNVSNSFGTKGKRNKKKTDFKLNKHCMHLVRGLLMGIELLETGKIVTYRKNDLELLHSILNGDYMESTGRMRTEFYDLVDDLKAKASYAFNNTVLVQEVDREKLEYFYHMFLNSSLKERN